MSLHHAAQHLAAQGRGPDTTLVHMAPGEVLSLQQLAMANGGSLTINPQTGLPEAGFLSSILPTVIGAGIMAATGGAAAPAVLGGMSMPTAIGLGIGGLEFARTGSLQKGLMAGLGAYGGAGLGAGLMGAGTGAISAETGSSAVKAAETLAAENAAKTQALQQASLNQLGKQAMTPQAIEAMVGQQTALNAAQAAPQQLLSAAEKDIIAQNAIKDKMASTTAFDKLGAGAKYAVNNPSDFMKQMGGGSSLLRTGLMAAAPALAETTKQPEIKLDQTPADKMVYNAGRPMDAMGRPITPMPDVPDYGAGLGQDFGRQQNYFPNAGYTTPVIGQKRYAAGGPVEQMSQANAVGMNTGYPQADITGHAYATPWQTPTSQNVVQGTADTGVNRMTGQMLARGGISDAYYNLGGYSDGGRLLRGPGDGVSDSIPATIGNKRPARLADGEFVVPARIVSELGNGSTEAGARKLYAMMDRVQKARGKTVGKGRVAKNTRADKYLPA
jgi:hypothetical protein